MMLKLEGNKLGKIYARDMTLFLMFKELLIVFNGRMHALSIEVTELKYCSAYFYLQISVASFDNF